MNEKKIKILYNPKDICNIQTYKSFFGISFKTYNKYFPQVRIKIKAKTIQNPWITKYITKSSKKKLNLYDQFLKKRTPENKQK